MGCLPSRPRHRSAATNQEEHPVLSDGDFTIAVENHMDMAVALCNIPLYGNSEHMIIIGERLDIISEEDDMLRVTSASTGTESIIPRNCVSRVYNRWLFDGISRRNAEELLMLPQNHTGSFLIRKSQTNPGSYSLSIRQNSYTCNIKHYRILQLHNGWFFIHPSQPFSTINQLVDYYSSTANGILCQLTEPCLLFNSNTTADNIQSPGVIRRPNINWREITRSMIRRQPKSTCQESLVSEGLRETMNAYIYFTEESCCED